MLESIAFWLPTPAGKLREVPYPAWTPELIWTNAAADAVLALAYFTIPATLGIVAWRRGLIFHPLHWLFAAFVLLCGAEHLSEAASMWVVADNTEGVIKIATAILAVVAAVALWGLRPALMALPSPSQLHTTIKALQESDTRYRSSFERSPAPTCTLNMAGVITGISDSWLALLGYKAGDVVGHPISEFTEGRWDPVVLERLQAEGELHDLERRFTRKDGASLDTLVSVRLENPGGANWIVCVLFDISARRKAEKALRISEERLHRAQRMDAVGQLSGGIAHDFNNMLQGISGGLDLIERRIKTGRFEEAGQYLAMSRQSIDQAAALTHRMLAFARRQALQPRDVSPADLIAGMKDLMATTLGRNVPLVLNLGGGDWHARCDPNQLQSAMLNVVINARDAMPDGGSLDITLADRRLEADSLPNNPELEAGDYIEIIVTDTGTGMPPDVLGRAFEPFFTTKPAGRGTGLGLSQIYGFVRQSGGAVQLESPPGEGVTVRLYLPRHAQPAFLPADPVSTTRAPTKQIRGTVLLVEDEEKVRAVIAETLSDLGCRVLEAEDGTKGLAIVQSRNNFDLLLTDIGLPGLTGRQLADAARERNPQLPVLLITGYAGAAIDDTALAPGVELMRKPFTMDTLMAQVATMLEGVLVSS
jgi:PAS domain S-box-containing protein